MSRQPAPLRGVGSLWAQLRSGRPIEHIWQVVRSRESFWKEGLDRPKGRPYVANLGLRHYGAKPVDMGNVGLNLRPDSELGCDAFSK